LGDKGDRFIIYKAAPLKRAGLSYLLSSDDDTRDDASGRNGDGANDGAGVAQYVH
jgi:hypothetical protein